MRLIIVFLVLLVPVCASGLDWEIKFYHTDGIISKDFETVKKDMEESKQVITTPKRKGQHTLYKGEYIKCSYAIEQKTKGIETLTLICNGEQQLVISTLSCISVRGMPELRNHSILNVSDLKENMTFRFVVKCNCML